jgi:hypothetical protein
LILWVLLDDLAGFQHLPDIFFADAAMEHALNRVHSEDQPVGQRLSPG